MPLAAKKVNKREDKIQLRIKTEDKEVLERASATLGVSMTSFIVSNALRAAKKELSSSTSISVNYEDGLLLAKLLDNPPKPTTYLKKAAKEYLLQYSSKSK